MSTVVEKSPGLQFDEDGFLLDPLSWTPKRYAGLHVTEKPVCWSVLNQCLRNGF